MLQLSPDEIDRFKSQIAQQVAPPSADWDIDDGERVQGTLDPQKHAPRWWHPERLPDADLLRLTRRVEPGGRVAYGYWLYFSKKTGVVYVYRWTT